MKEAWGAHTFTYVQLATVLRGKGKSRIPLKTSVPEEIHGVRPPEATGAARRESKRGSISRLPFTCAVPSNWLMTPPLEFEQFEYWGCMLSDLLPWRGGLALEGAVDTSSSKPLGISFLSRTMSRTRCLHVVHVSEFATGVATGCPDCPSKYGSMSSLNQLKGLATSSYLHPDSTKGH